MNSDIHGNDFIRPDENTTSNSWMISFADLLSLMLTFFILLFAMSDIRVKEWHELTTSLNDKLNPGRVMIRFEEEQRPTQPLIKIDRGLNLSYVHNLLKEQLMTRYDKHITLTQKDDRIIVSLKSTALFKAGDAAFSSNGLPIVKGVSDAVAKLSNKLEVHGHTDPRPISTKRYPSNWELSLARSDAVARLINAAGYGQTIDTLGMAASRYNITDTDKSDATRMALARRVDIVIRETENF